MQIWEHCVAVIQADPAKLTAYLDAQEPLGLELVSITPLVIGGQMAMQNGQLVQGQPQSAFMVVLKRPKPETSTPPAVEE